MIVPALFALSGAAGLVLESVLLRQLSLLLGSGAAATSVVLAAFMGGLALGAALLAPTADRSRRPLRLFGWIEIAVGASGIALVLILGAGREALLAPLRLLEPGVARATAEILLAGGALLVPTALMGASLPVLSRFAVERPDRILAPLGLLYGINTLGGAVGVFFATFFLFERVGVARSGCLAGSLDVAVGVAAIGLDRVRGAPARTSPPANVRAEDRDVVSRPRQATARVALVAAFLGGASVLGYEVVWTRLLSLSMRSFSYSFGLMLSLFLLGIVLGSLALASLAPRVRDAGSLLGVSQVAMGASVAVSLLYLPTLLLPPEGAGFEGSLFRSTARAALFVLPPTILSGIAFPLAARAVVSRGAGVGKEVGAVLAANTLGAVGGSLATGLVLLPALGAPHALVLLAFLNAVSGAMVVAVVHGALRGRTWIAAAIALLCLLPLALPADRFVQAFVRASRGRDRARELLFFHEGATDTVAIVKKDYGFYDPDAKSLITNGVAMSATVKPVWRYMAAEGHLPVFLAGSPRRVLAIGVGTGITLGAVLSHREVESVDAVELSEGVLRGLPLFAAENSRADSDPRVRIVHDDGRHFLEMTGATYDVITVEPPPPIVAGSTHLYSLDFYRLARRHLEPGGVLAQWLPLHAQSLLSARMTARTFLDAFPHVQLWLPSIRDAVLVGSALPLRLDARRLRDAYDAPATLANLERAYLETPAAFLGMLLLDREAALQWAGDAPTITDDRPRMEFFRSLGPGMTDRQIDTLLELPQASWGWISGVDDLKRRVEEENRALRLYVRSEIEDSSSLAREAARESRGTEFFRYRLGCASEQLASLAGRPGEGAQLAKCRALDLSPGPPLR